VLKFRHHNDLFRWYSEGVDAVQPTDTVPLRAPAADVLGGAGTFVARLTNGSVATWSTSLHGHLLGRSVNRDTPPNAPCALDLPVDMVGGIDRAVLRGSLGGVVTGNGAAYVWGDILSAPLTGGDFALSSLFGKEEQQLRLVVIEDGGEQLDVVDMDVGMSHLVCLTAGGRVWVAGTNEHGQLGLPPSGPKTEWTSLGGFVARKVVCGPQSTFFICDDT
jgi:hypothetical protein